MKLTIRDGKFSYPVETESQPSSRLLELVEFVNSRGAVSTFEELAELDLREEEFERIPSRDYRLGFDNTGTISVFMRSRHADAEWRRKFGGGDRFHWGYRPRLGEKWFDPTGGPAWLVALHDEWWREWKESAAGYYDAKESASFRCGPHWE